MTELIFKPEVAQMCHTSENTLDYWVQIGYAPPSAKIGRRRVWRKADVQAWIDAQFDSAS